MDFFERLQPFRSDAVINLAPPAALGNGLSLQRFDQAVLEEPP